MKYFLNIMFPIAMITLAVGFYLKSSDEKTGELLIGLSVAFSFFILMPLFIYHRWKDKNMRDYWLTSENIRKMQNYEKDKWREKRKK